MAKLTKFVSSLQSLTDVGEDLEGEGHTRGQKRAARKRFSEVKALLESAAETDRVAIKDALCRAHEAIAHGWKTSLIKEWNKVIKFVLESQTANMQHVITTTAMEVLDIIFPPSVAKYMKAFSPYVALLGNAQGVESLPFVFLKLLSVYFSSRSNVRKYFIRSLKKSLAASSPAAQNVFKAIRYSPCGQFRRRSHYSLLVERVVEEESIETSLLLLRFHIDRLPPVIRSKFYAKLNSEYFSQEDVLPLRARKSTKNRDLCIEEASNLVKVFAKTSKVDG